MPNLAFVLVDVAATNVGVIRTPLVVRLAANFTGERTSLVDRKLLFIQFFSHLGFFSQLLRCIRIFPDTVISRPQYG